MTPLVPSQLRSVLVGLDGSVHSQAALSVALDWAVRFGAELVGMGIIDQPSISRGEAVPLGAMAYKVARDEARLADARARVRAFLQEFRTRCEAAGVAVRVIEDIGDPGEQIVRQAQRVDLVMLGRETHYEFETQAAPDRTLGRVLRASPRPVVVVPREPTAGTGVLLAYGGGREIARTLQTFCLLGLADAETVEIIGIQRELAQAEALIQPAGDLLAAHGIACRLHPIGSAEAPAEVLLDEARRQRPRLIVIGAQGHHPVRDLFATSVTRAVLDGASVPVLVGA